MEEYFGEIEMPLECEVTLLQKKVRELEFQLLILKSTCDGLVRAVTLLNEKEE